MQGIYLFAILILFSGCVSESSVVTESSKNIVLANEFVSCGKVEFDTSQRKVWKISRPYDWVILGSSTAAGSGASSVEKSWVGLVSSHMVSSGVRIHNLAKGGNTTYHALSSSCIVDSNRPSSDMLHNVDEALTYKPDLVLLNFPSNDVINGFSINETVFNLMLIRQQLAEKNIATIVLLSQPRGSNKDIQKKMVDIDILLKRLVGGCQVELMQALSSPAGGLAAHYDSGDGIHLNDKGHEVIANAVLNVIKSDKCVVLL